jgi:hypothetical protein
LGVRLRVLFVSSSIFALQFADCALTKAGLALKIKVVQNLPDITPARILGDIGDLRLGGTRDDGAPHESAPGITEGEAFDAGLTTASFQV